MSCPRADALMWFRDDLRLFDNAALSAAASHGLVVGLYILEGVHGGMRQLGRASQWWLHHSLWELAAGLAEHDIPLLILSGDPRTLVPEVTQQVGARFVAWGRRYQQAQRDVDAAIKTRLRAQGVQAHSYPGFLLTEPWEITTGQGTPFKVFTPFFAALSKALPEQPVPPPLAGSCGPGAAQEKSTEMLAELGLLPQDRGEPDWAAKFKERWTPGETGAIGRFERFLTTTGYATTRDFPGEPATSNLSPHLRFGEISIRHVWESATDATFRKELGWRDFAWHRLFHIPTLPEQPIRTQFRDFPWYWAPRDGVDKPSARDLTDWQRGCTGIELVDAGMRELWETGHMHNRVRMVAGSLLTKNLGIHWRHGEEWFWDTLVDADPASNAFNWQWVAGCGDDAAPYFRIFNPDTQAKKFDPDGRYRAQWLPSISCEPIVDLKDSRALALERYRAGSGGPD